MTTDSLSADYGERMEFWRGRLARYTRLDLFALLVFSLLFIGYFTLRASPHRDILYVAGPFLLVYIWRHRDLLAARETRLCWLALALYWLYNLASVLWSPSPTILTVLTYARYELMGAIFTAGLSILIARHPETWRFLSAVFVGAAALAAIAIAIKYGLVLHHRGHFIRLEGVGRGVNSNICAAFYATAILMIAYARGQVGTAYPQPRNLVMPAVFAAIVVLTMGRGPTMALVAAILAITVLRGRWKLLAVLAAACVAAGAFIALNPGDWGQVVGRGDDNRFDLWRQAFAMVQAHPWFGSGVATELNFYAPAIDQHFNSTHDAYLGALVYGGGVGLVVLLLMLGAILRQSWVVFRRTGHAMALALSLYGLAYFVFETHTLAVNVDPEWLFFLLPAALATGLSNAEKTSILKG